LPSTTVNTVVVEAERGFPALRVVRIAK